MKHLGQRLNRDAAVCVDVGQNQIWACRHLWLNGSRFLTSGGLGTMGYSLPAAVGVKVAQPERQTLVVCGDGSFQMSMNELSALAAKKLDIKIVLIRNGVLGLVNQIQHTDKYHGPFGVELEGSPDFANLAAAYGIPSITVRSDAEADAALDGFLSMEGPCLLIADVSADIRTED